MSRKPITDSNEYVAERSVDSGLPADFHLDPYAGLATYRGKVIAGQAQIIDQIDSGYSMEGAADGVITYTFATSRHITGLYNNKNYGLPDSGYGFAPFSDAQKDAGRAAMQLWDDLIPQKFVEQKGLGNADITLANSLDPAQAYAFYPYFHKSGVNYPSDVFVADPSVNGTNGWFTLGGYGNTTIIHEVGHALGLSHPGAYNGAGATTYAAQAEYAQDSEQYSIMSYWAGTETGASAIDWNIIAYTNAQGPMLHDILTIQAKYGADPTTRVGDTTYGFNSNAGNVLYDFEANPYPYYAVYDAGGIDTIDTSGFTVSQFIDLHAGAFSSIGGAAPGAATVNPALEAYYGYFGLDYPDAEYYTNAEIAAVQASLQSRHAGFIAGDTGVGGITTTEYQNFAIAYGTTIENATGGSARDLIYGNEVANVLKGLGGADVIRGYEGNDTIVGGAGADVLSGGAGSDTFVFDTANDLGNTITDFSVDDFLDFGQMDVDLSFIGGDAFSGTAGELRYSGGTLSGDFDGNGVADFSVALAGAPTLSPDQILAV